jgi:TPR repeat protein
MLIFARRLFSMIVLACGLCSPVFADQGIDALRAKADQGDATAQVSLAQFYYEGDGVPRDHAEAVKWLRKAADQGNVTAQADLARRRQESKRLLLMPQ